MAAELQLIGTTGFGGKIHEGLKLHPSGDFLIYPLGCTVVVEAVGDAAEQTFLQGHTDHVSCVAVSKSGRYIASGQVTHPGYKADVIVWDFETRTRVHTLSLHQVEVIDLAFSPTERFLLTLGGIDDGSLALWDLQTGKAVAGRPTSDTAGGHAKSVAFCNSSDLTFVSAGHQTIRVWDVHPHTLALNPANCALRTLRTVFNSVLISDSDQMAYCCSERGDVISINIEHRVLKNIGPEKTKFSLGVQTMVFLDDGHMLIGAGDGTLAVLTTDTFKVVKSTKLADGISSIALQGKKCFVGTQGCDIFELNLADLSVQPRVICDPSGINDVEFPSESSEIFVTCSNNSIRIWHTPTGKQLKKIEVPGVTCTTTAIRADGAQIISGWTDGKIRAFGPETGKLQFEINNAHNKGVTALAITHNSAMVVSGGGDGQVRLWRVGPSTQTLIETMKEHKSAVRDIRIRQDDSECVSASADGSCIVWDLQRFVRNQVLFASTSFAQVRYHPEEVQLLTVGSDRKAHYWEAFDGSLIREIETSTAALNALDISSDGLHFVVGGDDRLLKVFSYNEGELTHIGQGHSDNITAAAVDPFQRYIVSVTASGSIFRWAYPHEQLA